MTIIKQSIPPQNREESPFFKTAMKMQKSAKSLQNMSPEKHKMSKEDHKKKVDRMHGRYNQLMSKYYGSVGHEYMKDLHDKRARDLMGDDFEESFETEEEFASNQQLQEELIKSSEEFLTQIQEESYSSLTERRLKTIRSLLNNNSSPVTKPPYFL